MDRPIIGVLAQETKSWEHYSESYKSYISASYVKAVESSGGRVVPVFIDKDEQYYRDMASSVNGFLFPGGAADVTLDSGYARSGNIVYHIVTYMNSTGEVKNSIPILGVCLGMELITNIAAGGADLRTPCSVKNEVLKLDFQPGFKESSLFSEASDEVIQILSTDSAFNFHRQCLTQETITQYNQTQWKILAYSTGNTGEHFISAMEHNDQPIALIIFHPEKNAFEWKPDLGISHDFKSISAARLFYDWLVAKSRSNDHKFKSLEEEDEHLIYNYSPIYTGKENLFDTQTYYFN